MRSSSGLEKHASRRELTRPRSLRKRLHNLLPLLCIVVRSDELNLKPKLEYISTWILFYHTTLKSLQNCWMSHLYDPFYSKTMILKKKEILQFLGKFI